MPVMDGMQATEKIMEIYWEYVGSDKNKKHIGAPKVVAVTAFKNQDSKDLAIANGMKHILFKPLKLADVKDCL